MSELYKLFGASMAEKLDFSDDSLLALYNHESYGTGLNENNGYAFGKKYLNVQVAMWREDLLRGWISKAELYEDERFPTWWLDSVLDNLYSGSSFNSILEHCQRM